MLVDEAYRPDGKEKTEKHVSDYSLRLTGPESQELAGEIATVISRWRNHTRSAPGERDTYSVLTLIQPIPDWIERHGGQADPSTAADEDSAH